MKLLLFVQHCCCTFTTGSMGLEKEDLGNRVKKNSRCTIAPKNPQLKETWSKHTNSWFSWGFASISTM